MSKTGKENQSPLHNLPQRAFSVAAG